MKISFVSNLCSLEKYNSLIPQNFRMGQQYQKYFRLIAEGLKKNGCDVSTLSIRPVNRRNSKKIIFKKEREAVEGINYKYLSTINFPIIKNIWAFLCIFFSVATLKKEEYVILDLLNFTMSVATYLGSKISKTKIIGVLTDMPTMYVGNENKKPTFQQKLTQRTCSSVPDAYLILTKEMNDIVNPKNKPSIIIEGFADISMMNHNANYLNSIEDSYCFYAGGLNKLYGLDMLVQGFLKADIPNFKLKICGNGPYSVEIKELSKKHSSIEYFGVQNNDIVVEMEESAALLVNPRYTNSLFTKYSFPSKNMEYMATGIPMLTTILPGMPPEYYPYVYLLEEESVSGMAEKLKYIMSLPLEERINKGKNAKEWILNNKNNVEMTKKITDFINSAFSEEQ